MKCFKLEQSAIDIVSQSGLALIGQAVKRYTLPTQELDTQVALRNPGEGKCVAFFSIQRQRQRAM